MKGKKNKLSELSPKKTAFFLLEFISENGIKKLMEIISLMNTKRSFKDKWEFSFNQASNLELHPEWVRTFVDGDGNFNFHFRKLGNSNNCTFSVYQNVHDFYLMKLLIKFFDCGKLYPQSVNNSFESAEKYYLNRKKKGLHAVTSFVVNTRNPIKNKIIPFLDKYPLFTTTFGGIRFCGLKTFNSFIRH